MSCAHAAHNTFVDAGNNEEFLTCTIPYMLIYSALHLCNHNSNQWDSSNVVKYLDVFTFKSRIQFILNYFQFGLFAILRKQVVKKICAYSR